MNSESTLQLPPNCPKDGVHLSVQSLDWVEGGSIHAMLLAEAKLATRFPYGANFYHHISSPIIQGMRESFINQLRKAPPRFIIEDERHDQWYSGIDSTHEFLELSEIVDNEYTVAYEGDGYVVHTRRLNKFQTN